MEHPRDRVGRNRSKNQRNLTIREIKMAICTHERLAPVGASEYRADWGGWRTTVACPACGHTSARETSDDAPAAATSPAPATERVEAVPS